jgi:hypothetical protein
MIDLQTLTTVATPVDGGGCHTEPLAIAAGQPILTAIQTAGYHAGTALDSLFPIAGNASKDDESLYPAIISIAICKALIESVVSAAEQAIIHEVNHG